MKFFSELRSQFPDKDSESGHELHQLAPMRIISDHGLHGSHGWREIGSTRELARENSLYHSYRFHSGHSRRSQANPLRVCSCQFVSKIFSELRPAISGEGW